MNKQYLYHHVAVQAEQGETISTLGYKTLCQGDMSGCIRPYMVTRDGECRLLYATGSMVSLRSRFSFVSEEQQGLARKVMNSLAEVLRLIDDRSFLERMYLIADPDYIFVKPETGEIFFLIVPLTRDDAQEQYYMWGESIAALIRRLTESDSEWHIYADKTTEGLEKGDHIPLEAMLDAICNLKETPERNRTCMDVIEGELELRCEDINGSVAFFVRKPEFVMGKDAQADGVIEHNQAVSRRHCVIRRREDGWYVADLASTNHTYLDGRKLLPDEEIPIRDGSLLRVADMGFRVTIR